MATEGRSSPVHLPPEHSESDSTATNSSDEFDWNAGENINDATAQAKAEAKRVRRLWLLFLKLSRWVRLLVVGGLGVGILITPYLVFLFRFKSSLAYKQVASWSIWLSISWAAATGTALIVDTMPRFIVWILFVFWGKAPENVKTYIELFMAVSTYLKIALDIGWLWIALSGTKAQIEPLGEYWVYVNRTVSALFVAGIFLLVEKIVLQTIAIRFHKKSLADRLLENQLGLRALDKLSVAPAQTQKQASRKRALRRRPQGSRGSSVDVLSGNLTRSTETMHSPSNSNGTSPIEPSRLSRASSPSTGKFKPDIHGPSVAHRRRRKRKRLTANVLEQLGSALGQVALKGSEFNRAGEIGSMYSARQLARQLFSNLSFERSFLVVDDFYPYFRDQADATAAFRLFDVDDNGDISKKEMREAVQRIYRDRKALTLSLKDMSSAVGKLDGVLLFITFLSTAFVCLLIFNRSNTIESLVPLGTIVLGFSFIFGHSAQLLFESMVFIFSTHAYDVGDLVIIDDQPLFVKDFGLYATTFTRVDGQQIVAPNALLASTKLLHNVRRSGSMWETTNLQVAYDTPLLQLEDLKTNLRGFMAENSREFGTPGCEIWIDKMEFQNDIQLIVAIEHKSNFQDWGGRWERRNKFMRHMKTTLEQLGVNYHMPLQPVKLDSTSTLISEMINNSVGNAGRLERSSTLGGVPAPTMSAAAPERF